MKILFEAESHELGTPMEIASALIYAKLNDVNDYELAELRKRELAAIAEHIQVFLKYSKGSEDNE